MLLTFKSPYLSLSRFPDTTLPSFTVITGHNGAGKSHLLQAIQSGNILVDIAKHQPVNAEIRRFDWNTLVPNDAGAFDGHGLETARADAHRRFVDTSRVQLERLAAIAKALSLPDHLTRNLEQLDSLTVENLQDVLANPSQASEAHGHLRNAIQEGCNAVKGAVARFLPHGATLDQLAAKAGCSVLFLNPDLILEDLDVSWGQTQLFQQSFAQLFVAYRDLWVDNELARTIHEKRNSEIRFMSDEEFLKKYNIPPWDFVNTTLQDAGLDFEIDAPYLYRKYQYLPRLTKRSNGVSVQFSSLSSGEKILMSFALCLYYANDNRQMANSPKLLLLDEIDAPLHPSMCRMVVNAIANALVAKQGIHVILATHSASTVALAPESSLYVMKSEIPGVHKVSKGEALSVLTYGVPTISINYTGRRQVFVESPIDAELYDELFNTLKPSLDADRSLVFIGATRRRMGGSGDALAGCDQVKRVVAELASAGNQTVLGLIDWDKRNTSNARVAVLGEGSRYAIENCLLDPLLVALTVAREAPDQRTRLGLTADEHFIKFRTLSVSRLQAIVDRVQQLVLGGKQPASPAGVKASHYGGGLSLMLSTDYLEMPGHMLEQRVLNAFPELNKYNRHAGDLLKRVVATVIGEFPEFVPREFASAFSSLLSTDLHSG